MQHTMLVHQPFHRPGAAHRTLTRAPLVPSQDVSRYQAMDMPAPTYDLDRKDLGVLQSSLLPVLAVAAAGAGIFLIQQIGAWLAR